MVAIQHDGVAFDFDYIENGFTTIGRAAAQLTTHFDARWKVFFRHGLNQAFIAFTKRICCRQNQSGLITLVLAVQSFFNFGQGVFVATMQIGHGLFGGFQQFTLCIGHFVFQGDDGVFFNFHDASFSNFLSKTFSKFKFIRLASIWPQTRPTTSRHALEN